MKWSVRRYQNEDGTYTQEGLRRYRASSQSTEQAYKKMKEAKKSYKQARKKNQYNHNVYKEEKKRYKEAAKHYDHQLRNTQKEYKDLKARASADRGKKLSEGHGDKRDYAGASRGFYAAGATTAITSGFLSKLGATKSSEVASLASIGLIAIGATAASKHNKNKQDIKYYEYVKKHNKF